MCSCHIGVDTGLKTGLTSISKSELWSGICDISNLVLHNTWVTKSQANGDATHLPKSVLQGNKHISIGFGIKLSMHIVRFHGNPAEWHNDSKLCNPAVSVAKKTGLPGIGNLCINGYKLSEDDFFYYKVNNKKWINMNCRVLTAVI